MQQSSNNAAISGFNQLPTEGFVRLWQIIGDSRRNIPAIIPESRSTWLNGVKAGTRPAPVKLSIRSVGWRVSDIREYLQKLEIAQ